ncbi:MAG: response regulator [Bacteroidetes bacterium]|nr:response regulator [Bacteroidota bacterium]
MHTTLREIVLIDDDKDINELHKRFLSTTELFEVVHVFDKPSQAIEFTLSRLRVNKDIPALYLIDVLMPELDGFELIDELNELFDKYAIPIRPRFVIVSGSQHSRDLEKFQRSENALHFVTKPLEWDHMQSIIGKMTI